jgi:hypothetical protein
MGNRLLSSSQGLTFAYDWRGRRTRVDYGNGASKLQMSSLKGRLDYEPYVPGPGAAPECTAYIDLHDRLVAQHRPDAGQVRCARRHPAVLSRDRPHLLLQ